MATLPVSDLAEPIVAGEIIVLSPADIEVGDRLREIDPVHAEALGWSMIRDGQINPIDVCQLPGSTGWRLAGPGGHRLTGALIVGMDGIEARVVSSSRHSRRLREAVENLFRRDLDPIDRAATIAELVLLKREKAGLEVAASRAAKVNISFKREVHQEAGAMLETISSIYGWSDELGAELGFTGRTIRNDLMLYRGLRPSLVTRLRSGRHPVLRNASQLRALAKLSADDQAHAVDMLLGDGAWEPCKTVAEAVRKLNPGKATPSPDSKRLSAFIGAFQRMSQAERKGALAQLAGLLPAGMRLTEGAE
jgi:hypothetical protein